MSELKFTAAGVLGQGALAGLFATTRLTRVNAEHYLRFRREGQPVIFVFWHGQLLPLVHCHRNEGVVVLVSQHADGEYIARVLERYGYRTARGSSTRGGIKGLRALIKAAREGHDLALSPDGPRGPRHEFKAGALLAAQVTGAPLIPLAAGASSAWHFDSWDRFMVPRPLSRITVEYAEPVWVDRDADEAERARLTREMQALLRTMSARVGASSSAAGSAPTTGAT